MKRVINDLNKIQGLKHAYIHRAGEENISTFGEEKMSIIHSSAELIEQYFMAAKGIEKAYNEMIFPLENGDNLIALLGEENTLVIALTKQKMNLPMLHMAFTVVIKKLNNGTYQQQTLRDAIPAAPKKRIQPAQEKNPLSKPTTRITPTPTPTKSHPKKTVSSFKSLFSNPFTSKTAKKNKHNERPYTLFRGQKIYQNETQKKSQTLPADKKLVYREQKD